jgi:hypothetical protein
MKKKIAGNEWLKEWKTNNLRWREILYRLNFPLMFYSMYSSPEELTEFLTAIIASKRKASGFSEANSDMFCYFRKILRSRHSNRLSQSTLYYVHSDVYGMMVTSKWRRNRWKAIKKGSTILFVQHDEIGSPEFLFDNSIVNITGIQLDKIRPIAENL